MRYPTLYDNDEIETIVERIISYWNENNYTQFVRQANSLYDKYGEHQADVLMQKIKKRIESGN